MELIVISYSQDINSEHELLISLFNAGLENFHLRKPDYSVEDYKKYIEIIPEKYHKNIVVHKYIDLFNEYNLKGVHFSSENKYRINEFNNLQIQKSISCHNFHEILNLRGFSYAFLSPVFDSISKEGYHSNFSSDELTAFFQKKSIPAKVIALGGISSENINKALSLGFDGVAVMGALWNNFKNDNNIAKTTSYFIELKRKCQQFARTY